MSELSNQARDIVGVVALAMAKGISPNLSPLIDVVEKMALVLDEVPVAPESAPLPTEPGVYLDRDGDVWVLSRATGKWSCFTDGREAAGLEPGDFAPLTRLEPVPDTASRVLNRVRGLFGAGALILLEVDEIAADFGVTS